MRIRRQIRAAVLWGGVFLCVGDMLDKQYAHAQTATSIEVHQLERNWKSRVGEKLYVTGRFGSVTGNRLELVGSGIQFKLTPTTRRPKGGTAVVEIYGELTEQAGRPTLNVEHLTELPALTEQFRQRRDQIPQGNYAALYELSRWVRDRAQWYADEQLRQLAVSSYREAFDWEEQALAEQANAQGLYELAQRGERLGLPPADVLQLVHRSLLVEQQKLLSTAQTSSRPARDLAERIATRLPATRQPTMGTDWELLERYAEDPVKTYRQATLEERNALHRALWGKTLAAALRTDLQARSQPLEALVNEARTKLPEDQPLIRELTIAMLEADAAQAARLTRGKALEVARQFAELQLAERAEFVKRQWLDAQYARLTDQDIEGRLQLAADFRSLVKEEATAAELYKEALRIEPGLTEAEEQLRGLGYERLGGIWQPLSQVKASELAEQRRARTGQITVGDSEQAVINRLRRPDRIVRTASATELSEQWIYQGPPAVYIYLRRNVATGRAVVTEIEAAN